MTMKLYCHKFSCNEAQRHYNTAKEYLNKSRLARDLIFTLERERDVLVKLVVAKDSENGFDYYGAQEIEGEEDAFDLERKGGVVVWNPAVTLSVINTKNVIFRKQKLSPYLALLHELAHAYQTYSEPKQFAWTKKSPEASVSGRMLREQGVVHAIEHTVANELNATRLFFQKKLEGKRQKYDDLVSLNTAEEAKAAQDEATTRKIFRFLRNEGTAQFQQRVDECR